MERLGAFLRSLRSERGLTLREVTDRTEILASRWGRAEYAASFGHLAKLERGHHDIRLSTLISLAYIYSRPITTFLETCLPENYSVPKIDDANLPNSTVLMTDGAFVKKAKAMSGLAAVSNPPETTTLLPGADPSQHRYRQAMVGKNDRTLYPILRPGAVITVDTHRRAIAKPDEWTNEYDRPIYLLYTRGGYICGWCQFDGSGRVLNVVSHIMAKLDVLPLVYGRDVEVIGRIVDVTLCLDRGTGGKA